MFDNVEHLLTTDMQQNTTDMTTTSKNDASTVSLAEVLTQILLAAPRVKILTTSRQSIQLQEEYLFPLSGMALPTEELLQPLDAFIQTDAIQLFQQTARQNAPTFAITDKNRAAIAQFCMKVQGTPLAIVLGAANMDILTPQELVEAYEENIDILEAEWSDVPTRQQSVRAIFEYSWQLLDATTQQVFAALSVFQDGFTTKAARKVANAFISHLRQLHSQSFIVQTVQGRYQVHELLRQFGMEKLCEQTRDTAFNRSLADNFNRNPVRERHMQYYLDWLGTQTQAIRGSQSKKIMTTIRPELNNIRTAWQYGLGQVSLSYLAQSSHSLFYIYDILSLTQEALDIFTQSAQHLQVQLEGYRKNTEVNLDTYHYLHGLFLASQAYFHLEAGDTEKTSQKVQDAIRKVDTIEGQNPRKCYVQAMSYWLWAWVLYYHSDLEEAKVKAMQSITMARQSENQGIMIDCLRIQGEAYAGLGDENRALESFMEARTLCHQSQNQQSELDILQALGELKEAQGELTAATIYFEKAREISYSIANESKMYESSYNLCRVFTRIGEYVQAEAMAQENLHFYENIGQKLVIGGAIYCLGVIYLRLGLYTQAIYHFRQASQHIEMNAHQLYINSLVNLSTAYQAQGDYQQTQSLLDDAMEMAEKIPANRPKGYVKKSMAYLLCLLDKREESVVLYEEALSFYPEQPKHPKLEIKANLAHAYQQSGNLTMALMHIEDVLAYLDDHAERIYQFLYPFEVYWNCYRVLQACQDTRANSILKQAYRLLHTWADRIDNQIWRMSFLDNVAVNRELMAEARRVGLTVTS
ncbi:MAG: tetratricopeptide repeat protein [Chloroflexota bacterium]